MNKNKALTAEETKAKRAEYSRACHVAQAAAVAAGFALSYGPGYWTALTTFCRENGIPHPSTRGLKAKAPKPAPKPTAEELAAAKRAAHAKAERERRARVKAAKAAGAAK